MALLLEWQHYASWLISCQGMDPYAALDKVGRLYQKQYKKDFKTEKAKEIQEFLEERL